MEEIFIELKILDNVHWEGGNNMEEFFDLVSKFKRVIIQVHDNPDADAIASGFAMKHLISLLGKDSEIIYYGRPYRKPNLTEMVTQLKIPVTNRSGDFAVNDDELLVILDAQRDNSNLFPFHAKYIACIDHHISEANYPYIYSDIRHEIGSCVTIVASYILSLTDTIPKDVATAIYFGIHMDTNGFIVKFTNLDKDIRDHVAEVCNTQTVMKLIRTSLTIEDIDTCSQAMQRIERYENIVYSNIGDVDDNLLGHIADLLSEIAGIDVVIIHSERENGYRVSVRSYHDYISAENIIDYITSRVGTGGGHLNKSAGFIPRKDFNQIYPNNLFKDFLKIRVSELCQSMKLLTTGVDDPLLIFGDKSFRNAVKRKFAVRYIDLSKYFEPNVEVGIKTLEGLITLPSDYIAVIGLEGEVYGFDKETFSVNHNLEHLEEEALCDRNINTYGIKLMTQNGNLTITKESVLDLPIAVTLDDSLFKIMSLTDNVKVRTLQGDQYVRNNGYLVYQNKNNFFLVNDEVFNITYRIIPNNETLEKPLFMV